MSDQLAVSPSALDSSRLGYLIGVAPEGTVAVMHGSWTRTAARS